MNSLAAAPRLLVLLVYITNYSKRFSVIVDWHVLSLHIDFMKQLFESTVYIGV